MRVTSMDAVLARLTRALCLYASPSALAWARRSPYEVLRWPEDLPALPAAAKILLQWRAHEVRAWATLELPCLRIEDWRTCAERTRARGALHLSERLWMDARGVFEGDELVAEHLDERLELEALLLEHLPGTRPRRTRLRGPLAPWVPDDPDPHEPGTLLCDARGVSYALMLAEGLWVEHTAGSPDEDPLPELRSNAWGGAVTASPRLQPSRRSRLEIWPRPPMSALLARLGPLLPPQPLDGHEALPDSLRALWQHTGGSAGPLWRGYRLLGPQDALALLEEIWEGDGWTSLHEAPDLLPFCSNDLSLLCVDLQGQYGPPGSVIELTEHDPTRTVLHESLEDWLESFLLHREDPLVDELDDEEDEEDPAIASLVSPGCPRRSTHRQEPLESEPSWLESAFTLLRTDPHARTLARAGSLPVLRDWLLDQEVELGPATLATLVRRLGPLLE